MTATLPAQGPAVWTDYVDNWRKADTQWLQDRIILRFADTTARDAALTAPGVGQVVYNQTTDVLELRNKAGTWQSYKPLPSFLQVTTDDVNGVTLSHSGGGGKGMVFAPGGGNGAVTLTAPLSSLGNVLKADAAGVTIQSTGQTAAVLTTDTSLVSSIPVKTPSITLTGSGTVFNAAGKTVTVGTLVADVATLTTLSVSGTITAGVINASGVSTINGNTLKGGFIENTIGYVTSWGYFTGDGGGANIRSRNPTSGAVGGSVLQVQDTTTTLTGSYFNMHAQLQILDGRNIAWYNAGVTLSAPIAPNVVSAGDPGAANYPDGTLWIT